MSFGGRVLRADAVYKQHANRTDAFAQRFGQPVAWLEADRPCWQLALAAGGLQGQFATLALKTFTIDAVVKQYVAGTLTSTTCLKSEQASLEGHSNCSSATIEVTKPQVPSVDRKSVV